MLNIHGIIDHCCGVASPGDYPYTEKQKMLEKQFAKHKLPVIKAASIQKWLERGQIPGDRIVDLHVLAKKQKKPINLYEFIKPDTKAIFG